VGVQMVLRGPHNNLVGIMTFNALDTRNALPTTQYIDNFYANQKAQQQKNALKQAAPKRRKSARTGF
jgi:hypothetical protein